MSGVKVSDAALAACKDVSGGKLDAAFLRLSDDMTSIELDESLDRTLKLSVGTAPTLHECIKVVSSVTSKLPANTSRYVILDVHSLLDNGTRPSNRIVLISWVPKATPLRIRVVHSSSLAALSSAANLQTRLDATAEKDVEYNAIIGKAFGSSNPQLADDADVQQVADELAAATVTDAVESS